MTKVIYRTVGVSFPNPKLLEDAKARAARLGFSFSAYVVRLIQEDLSTRGDFVLKEGAIPGTGASPKPPVVPTRGLSKN